MGRGLQITLDEWFFHWFEDQDKQPIVSALFDKIFSVCDKLVFEKGNRHSRKLFHLVESSSMFPPNGRLAVKKIVRLFIQNSEKIEWVESANLLSEDVISKLPRKDIYIAEMCMQSQEKVIITTDEGFLDALQKTSDQTGIRVISANDFISRYPNFL